VLGAAPTDAHHRRPGAIRDVDYGPRESVEQRGVINLGHACRFELLLTS
jgi:hypothetical protein